MSMFEMFMVPTSEELESDFDSLGRDMDDFREPLRRVVEQVASSSIRTNFDVGGRPAWEPLEEQTLERGGNTPLVRSGRLRDAASSPQAWSVSRDEAKFNMTEEYGLYHDQGTRTIPARPFALLQEEDIDKAERIIGDWVDERIASNGFGGVGGVGGFFVSF